MENRERAMVQAAVDFLSERGYTLDSRINAIDKEFAIAAIIEQSSQELFQEAEFESYTETRRRILIDGLNNCDRSTIGSVYTGQICGFYEHWYEQALTKLPYNGESDEEGWRDIDNAQRVA